MSGYQWYDFVGNLGVAMVLGAYLGLTLNKLRAGEPLYLLLNLIGSGLLLVSLLFAFNLSAMIIQVFWIAISLVGLARWRMSRPRTNRA